MKDIYTYQNDSFFKIFKISLCIKSPFENLNLDGNGFDILIIDNIKQIYLNLPNEKCLFIEIHKNGSIIIYTPSLYRYPIYYKILDDKLILSNQITKLFGYNDIISIDSFVFFRHLTGSPYPDENYFKEPNLLKSSSKYILQKKKLIYFSSTLNGGLSNTNNDAIDRISKVVNNNFSSGVPVSILLSGGYDSRFNLVLANHYSKKYGNKIKLYHEYKNINEFEITKRIAENVNLPITIIDRTTFINKDERIFRDKNIIELQSGFYRENLVRWHKYLNWISFDNPGSIIWGLGVEAHKGKYYNFLNNIQESINVFGTKNNIIEIAKQAGVYNIENTENVFFQNLNEQSNEFESLTNKIDFVHYHTYCAGFGKRCHDLFQNFNMSFPFLDPEFLQITFSLPRIEKENFKIVKDGIQRFSNSMLNIPFTSGNEKSLNQKSNFIRLKDDFKTLFGNQKRKFFKTPSPKSNSFIKQIDLENIISYVPNSEVIAILKELLLGKWQNVNSVQLDYILQSYYYLVFCEKEYKVTFVFDK